MYQLTTEHSFDSAHFLAGYDGKCGNLHGHRWRVLLTVQSETLREDRQQKGMCVDFADPVLAAQMTAGYQGGDDGKKICGRNWMRWIMC